MISGKRENAESKKGGDFANGVCLNDGVADSNGVDAFWTKHFVDFGEDGFDDDHDADGLHAAGRRARHAADEHQHDQKQF